MKTIKREQGQTVIETALVIILILMLFFGIAEIARAWWFKGQINNAARVGVRVAVVTSPITVETDASCGSADKVVIAACDAISNADVKNSARVSVATSGNAATPQPGDTITVTVTGDFNSIVPGLSSIGMGGPGGWTQSLYKNVYHLTGTSIMRHE
jgi:Flp pilus assembly protein TadG